MRITSSNFDYQPVLAQLTSLNQTDRDRASQLFQKLARKGHLGSSSASQLACLLKDCQVCHLAPNGDPQLHEYVLAPGKAEVDGQIAPVNTRQGRYHKTPLQLAINNYQGSREEIDKCLADPALDINLTDKDGWSALYQATQLEEKEILEAILQIKGVQVNIKNVDGSTPLIRAADRNNDMAVKLLLEQDADPDLCNCVGTALTYAARKGHVEVVRLLVAHGADVNLADSSQQPPLKLAMQGAHTEVEAILRQAGAKETASATAVEEAVSQGLIQSMEAPLEKDGYGRTACHYWALHPSDLLWDHLDKLGVNWDEKDRFGRTPLHYATMSGNLGCVQKLVEKGVQIEATDVVKWTPLFFAAQHNQPDVAQWLVEHSANVHHEDKFGWTALDKAAESKSPEICRLLSPHVDLNRQAADGRTALHKAAVNGALECIQVLRKLGANPNIADQNGKTPKDYAAAYPECLRALIQEILVIRE